MDHRFACRKPTHMYPMETRPFMFQHLFAGHAGPVINKMAPCGYRGPAANSRSKDDRKTNPRSVYRRSKGWPVKVTGAGLPDSQEGGFMRKHCKSYQLISTTTGGGTSDVGASWHCVCWSDLLQLPSRLCHYSTVCPPDYIRLGLSTMHQIYCPIHSPIIQGEE